jgi:hypothetical protein
LSRLTGDDAFEGGHVESRKWRHQRYPWFTSRRDGVPWKLKLFQGQMRQSVKQVWCSGRGYRISQWQAVLTKPCVCCGLLLGRRFGRKRSPSSGVGTVRDNRRSTSNDCSTPCRCRDASRVLFPAAMRGESSRHSMQISPVCATPPWLASRDKEPEPPVLQLSMSRCQSSAVSGS